MKETIDGKVKKYDTENLVKKILGKEKKLNLDELKGKVDIKKD